MPRISPRLWKHAQSVKPALAKLLPICRDLDVARNELRWLKEYATERQQDPVRRQAILHQLVTRRGKGEPLQYILGNEYFGNLQLRCKPGVLIPRWETAASVSHLVDRLLQHHGKLVINRKQAGILRVVDFCTGSGCIPLLFQHEFGRKRSQVEVKLECVGVDISPAAIELAEENRRLQLADALRKNDSTAISSLDGTRFIQADIFRSDDPSDNVATVSLFPKVSDPKDCHIMISNPPYISQQQFFATTERSVRKYEPRLALVPDTNLDTSTNDGDQFYPRLWHIAEQLQARMVLFEIGDMAQAMRVARMAISRQVWEGIEIWRDDPAVDLVSFERLGDNSVKVIGKGHGRSVFAYRD